MSCHQERDLFSEEGSMASQLRSVGPYRLDRLLGRGGMGEVYKAWDERLERWVAVKRLQDQGDETARARFRREASSAARIRHPAIIRVFEVFRRAGDDWIVLELVAGPSLKSLVRDGPLDHDLVLNFGSQVASGLAAIHAAGIVHRDLKSENVMAIAAGCVKILDFGLAKRMPVVDSEESVLTLPGHILGTPRAMAPEQMRGHPLDGRCDLFALGVLLYELLTARSPFQAGTPARTVVRLMTHQQPPVRDFDAAIPARPSELVDCLLEKKPAHRPASAEEVAESLAEIMAGRLFFTTASRSDLAALGRDPQAESVVVKTLLISRHISYAAPAERRDDRGAATLPRRHERQTRDLLERCGGVVLDTADGFLVLLDSPGSAVELALANHERINRLSAELEIPLAACVGIHLGEVILRCKLPNEGDSTIGPLAVEGPAEATVRRLLSLSTGGQILLTGAAHAVVRREPIGARKDLRWLSHGRYRLQGLAREVEVFEVGVPGISPLSAPSGSEQALPVARTAPAAADDSKDDGCAADPSGARPVLLRSWEGPELPDRPYPVLMPYTHPALLAGREKELSRLSRLLRMRIPILGLGAPSGTGKSSLLLGGLVPALRAEGCPVALVRHPREAGVGQRLLGDLLDGVEPLSDSDWRGFMEGLHEAEHLAGKAPLLVLDQFEQVLHKDATEARAVFGVLLAATGRRRLGIERPLCRWLLAYRQEYHGDVTAWLRDVLSDARSAAVPDLEALPHDLSTSGYYRHLDLSPLGTPGAFLDPLQEATTVFRRAIEKPLSLSFANGEPRYSFRFAPGHAERLAGAFARARLARPHAPLTPELQVVLAHLAASPGPDGSVHVPEDPDTLIDEALEEHLRRALEKIVLNVEARGVGKPRSAARAGRTRALLALRELATESSPGLIGRYGAGRFDEGLKAAELARVIGRRGYEVLENLARPDIRLIVAWRDPSGCLRYTLSHDRLAEVIVRLVEEGRHRGELIVDAELLSLRQLVALKTALHSTREAQATYLPARKLRRIEAHADVLLCDDKRRNWWSACRERRRLEHRRRATVALSVLLLLAVAAWGAWKLALQRAEQRALLEQLVEGEPEPALQIFDRLVKEDGVGDALLLSLLQQREIPMDLLERGLGAFESRKRSAVVLRAVDIALPWVEASPNDPVLLANLVWALDYGPGRDPLYAARAQRLRDIVLAPLRRLRQPPAIAAHDPSWIRVPAGTFLMGSPEGEGRANERPQHRVTVSAFRLQRHETTNAEYRPLLRALSTFETSLVPAHGSDDLPAAASSWYEAYTYAAWLGGRLPTEAEWEYAARAGCPYPYCRRDGSEAIADEVAWSVANSVDPVTGATILRPVMQLEPNRWGLFDMLGNRWEWTADWHGEYPATARDDPWGPPNDRGGWRTYRGGSYRYSEFRSRPAYRSRGAPGDPLAYQGLRVVIPEP